MKYKGYLIEAFGNKFTVFYMGDDIVFDTIDEAKLFIDGVA